MGFPVKENLISYYSILEKVFVFVGKDPLMGNIVIPHDDIDYNQRLTLKCRSNSTVSPHVGETKRQASSSSNHQNLEEFDVQMTNERANHDSHQDTES